MARCFACFRLTVFLRGVCMLCLRLSALVSSHSPEAYMVWKLPINNRCEFACVIMSPGDTLVTCPGCNRPLAPIRAAIDLSLCEPGHDEKAWKMDGGMRIPITVSRANNVIVCVCVCVFLCVHSCYTCACFHCLKADRGFPHPLSRETFVQ